jgi:hypothetical protein
MRSRLIASMLLATLFSAPSAARAAAPTGFPSPGTVAADREIATVAAADGSSAVAYRDTSGDVWATRVRADGTLGSPLPAAQDQVEARDLQVTVTERGELVVLWAAIADRSHAVIRYAVAPRSRSFSGVQTLARVSTNTGATPRIASLRGGTVAVIYRDPRPQQARGVLRFARRPPGESFGPARSLGRDGVAPEIAATPGGGAVLAWASGSLGRRNLVIASARRGAPTPGVASSVAARVRAFTLATSPDGTAWVTWTRREGATIGFARRIRARNVGAVGPVELLGTVAYGVPRVALGDGDAVLVAWNAQGPGLLPGANVALASRAGTRDVLGPVRQFDAGGFSQTSPLPAVAGPAPVILFTRQLPIESGVRNEVAAADAATGESIVLGASRTFAAPAAARTRGQLLVAWPAAAGGADVTVHP